MPVTTTGVAPDQVIASAKVLEIIALANTNETGLVTKAASVHGHSAADVTSGLLNLARLPAGSILTVIKARGDFGAAPGSWPTSRPTTRTDITVYWEGNTDPGGIVGAYDKWLVTV